MSHIRSIANIISDVQQLIEDMSKYDDTLQVGIELAYQLIEELELESGSDESDSTN